MNRLGVAKRTQIISALVEGNSIRATARMTGVSKDTVSKLLVDIGRACSEYQDSVMHDLPCKRLQCDEIWSFCHSKQRNVAPEHEGELGYGDVWTWTAIDADTKLVPSFVVGARTAWYAQAFMRDVAKRLAHQVQLTTDGHRLYLQAVWEAFAGDVDYAMLVKLYGEDSEGEKRYSPAVCTGTETRIIHGLPNPAHISTSYAERQNLTMRMGMRRFTRLTNAFSKKLENLECAVALHFMHYNFARKHQTLKGQTPAMAAGIADHVWPIEEIVGLLNSN